MKVEDRVVCVKSVNVPGCVLKSGKIYTIFDVWACTKCPTVAFNVGITTHEHHSLCYCGNRWINNGVRWIVSTYFAPLEYNSATEELANKEIVKETSDIPIKEPEKA